MKVFFYFFLDASVCLFGACCTNQSSKLKESTNNNLLSVISIQPIADTIVTMSIHNFMEIQPPIISLVIKNKKATIYKYQNRKSILHQDSIIRYPCSNGYAEFIKILNIGLTGLPTEADIQNPCKSLKDTLINGKIATEIQDFDAQKYLAVYKIEYKIGSKSKILIYKNPTLALQICPDSKERQIFKQIIDILSGL